MVKGDTRYLLADSAGFVTGWMSCGDCVGRYCTAGSGLLTRWRRQEKRGRQPAGPDRERDESRHMTPDRRAKSIS